MNTPRTYGGWRARRGFGVGNLTEVQTAVMAGCVLLPLGIWVAVTTFGVPMLVMPIALAISGATAVLTLVPHRAHGTSLGGALIIWLRATTARRKGWSEWETGVFTRHPRSNE